MFVKHRAYSDSEGFPWTVLAKPRNVAGRTEMVVKRWYEDDVRVAVLGEDGIATFVAEGKTLTLDPEHAITPEEA